MLKSFFSDKHGWPEEEKLVIEALVMYVNELKIELNKLRAIMHIDDFESQLYICANCGFPINAESDVCHKCGRFNHYDE